MDLLEIAKKQYSSIMDEIAKTEKLLTSLKVITEESDQECASNEDQKEEQESQQNDFHYDAEGYAEAKAVITEESDQECASNEDQKEEQESQQNDFQYDAEGYAEVYIDGSYKRKYLDRPSIAGFGVYWGSWHSLNHSEPVSGLPSDNGANIQAASCAMKQALLNGVTKLSINTASKYLIDIIAKWTPGSDNIPFGKPLKHKDELRILYPLLEKIELKWNYLTEPRSVAGYRLAHDLAKEGASMYKPRVKRLAN